MRDRLSFIILKFLKLEIALPPSKKPIALPFRLFQNIITCQSAKAQVSFKYNSRLEFRSKPFSLYVTYPVA